MSADILNDYDPVQAALMAEVVILVDGEDKVLGQASKKECKYQLASNDTDARQRT